MKPKLKAKPKKFKPRKKKKICQFCQQKFEPDFKDSMLLKLYITERGKIQAQRNSGACSKHQRALSRCIKRARHIGLLPITVK